MRKMMDGLYTWSIFNEEKKLPFNGLYLKTAFAAVLIDPPPMSDEDRDEAEKLGRPAAVFLTNKHHTRGSAAFRERWGAKISIHKNDLPLMEIPVDASFNDGETLAQELKAIRIPDAKTPGECALYWAKEKTMIVGDAVIGKPPGGLSMLPDEKFKDPRKAKDGLNVLLEFDFERLLVGDGASIDRNARQVLDEFLNKQG